MKDKSKLELYSKLFIRNLSPFIRPEFNISAEIYPSENEGAIIEFNINEGDSRTKFHDVSPSINKTLESIEQNLIAGNIGGIKFGGTNISMQNNRIVIIKGEDDAELWDRNAVENDIERIISPHRGAKS